MIRLLLKLVPASWRETIARDLSEEATRAGRRGLSREAWLAWQALRVAVRFGPRHWAWRSPGTWMSGLGSDLRAALRLTVRQPGGAAAIILTLALGIGLVTSVYAVFDHVLFRPIPGVRDDGRLLTVLFQPPGKPDHLGSGPYGALPHFRRAASLETVATRLETTLPVAADPSSDPVIRHVEFVTSDYFDVIGARPAHGRLLSGDEADGTRPVALVSDAFWWRELGGEPSAIGRAILVNGVPFTIVGVVDRFRGWDSTRVATVDIWMPYGVEATTRRAGQRADTVEEFIARRQRGVSLETAGAELRAIFAGLANSIDRVTRQFEPVVYHGLYTFGQDRTRQHIMRTFPFLMGGAALLLLVACANTANLLLARTRHRTRELALQSALGAGRTRLVRQLLVEATILAGAASFVGLLVAFAVLHSLRGLQIFVTVPELTELGIDGRVALFATAIAAATVLVFGLLPALRASRADLRALLPVTAVATPRSQRVRLALVAAQLALSLTLVCAAGVLLRSLVHLRTQDVGMRTRDVVSFIVNPRPLGSSTTRRDQVARDLIDRLTAAPGIETVAFASPPAFWRVGRTARRIRLDAAREQPDVEAETMTVSGAYFDVLGIPLIAGRTFRTSEFQQPVARTGGAAIVNTVLARQLFGDAPAIGQRIVRGSWLAPTAAVMSLDATRGEFVAERELEIVGVVGDTRTAQTVRLVPSPILYESSGQWRTDAAFYVRPSASVADTLVTAHRVVRELEPGLPVIDPGTVQDEIERLLPEERLFARVLAIVAALALCLGLAGTYAVMTYSVTERTREFAIRTALGAQRRDIARGVLGSALVVCGVGLAAGFGLFAAVSRVFASRVHGVSAFDPISLLAAAALLTMATVAAAWLPAHRATAVDPTTALRDA